MKRTTTKCLGAAVLCLFSTPAWGAACLTPTSEPDALVVDAGLNPGGLQQVRVLVNGFDLAPLAAYGVGCSVGISLESQIVGPPLWAIQKRALAVGLTVVDASNGVESPDFSFNPQVGIDLMGEAMGLNYYSWPIPIALAGFSTPSGGTLPTGPVELSFDVVLKPGTTIPDLIDDLEANGYIASDFSVTFSGTTFLLWSSTPFLTKIESVETP